MKQRDLIIIVCLAIIFPLIGLFVITNLIIPLNEEVEKLTGIDASKLPPLIASNFAKGYVIK
jgi:hypothetical protein